VVSSLTGRGGKIPVKLVDPDVSFVVAANDMPAMTVLTADMVSQKKAPKSDAPSQCLGNSADAIGQTLAVPVKAGQALRKECFAPPGSGPRIASMLENGQRLVAVSLDESSAIEGSLYPGCMVNVFALLKVRGKSGEETFSKTLLAKVEVWGIDRQLVSATPEEQAAQSAGGQKAPTRSNRIITLVVSDKQAQALQLASRNGTIDLALCNPKDPTPVAEEVTLLSDLTAEYFHRTGGAIAAAPRGDSPPSLPPAAQETPAAASGNQQAEPAPAEKFWTTTVIRASAVQTQSFPMPPRGAGSQK
jgi:Flp pilus assembly protein CpaB